MADLADVEFGLAALIAQPLFSLPIATPGGAWLAEPGGIVLAVPGGTVYQCGSVGNTPTGTPTKMYRGWPESTNLDADLAAGTAHVSVFSKPNATRLTTRFESVYRTVAPTVPTIGVAFTGGAATFSGAAGMIGAVILTLGTLIAPALYRYGIQATDTPASVAAALAALIPGASAAGAIVSTPTPIVACAVVTDQIAQAEVRRQVQQIVVSCWCPTPLVRDAIAGTIDTALAPLLRFVLPDLSTCVIRYVGTMQDDKPSKARVWRRDLTYSVEYPTFATITAPQMGAGTLNLT